MRSPPPEVVATWPRPNYVDPITRGNTLMIVELTLLPIAMIVVFLRLWVRIAWLKKSWWDDYLMLLAMVCGQTDRKGRQSGSAKIRQVFSIGTTVLVILASQLYGWDRHVWDVRIPTLVTGRKVSLCNLCHLKLNLTMTRHPWLVKHSSSSPPARSKFRFSCHILE
jgi:hypothetical protein